MCYVKIFAYYWHFKVRDEEIEKKMVGDFNWHIREQLSLVSTLLNFLNVLQFDNRGRNFLHVAIQNSDIESVLFLISVHADVNSRMRNSNHLAPLHLAVQSGSEIIVRNLVCCFYTFIISQP